MNLNDFFLGPDDTMSSLDVEREFNVKRGTQSNYRTTGKWPSVVDSPEDGVWALVGRNSPIYSRARLLRLFGRITHETLGRRSRRTVRAVADTDAGAGKVT